ncbi:MAG: tRNA pseudouridine(13) synthase TruD [Gammaproteobacteria bacterium]|nr:tRNA pseudouridine(13) synthase TruD [Gammaproteobacteria bacterium]
MSSEQIFQKDWSFDHWHYLYGKPEASAYFKQRPEDFVVTENLGFELTGEGENLFLCIEKRELNTQQVCEYLAKFFKKRLRDIGYAGLKDKQSVSRQWFSVQMNVTQAPDLSDLDTENIKLIEYKRHNKKLKVGALASNHFKIVLNQVENINHVVQKLTLIQHNGVPNYFGTQRFGFKGNNLNWADRMSSGEVIKNKKIKGFALSASRSYLFNQVVSQRLQSNLYEQAQNGDVFILAGSNSYFQEPVSKAIQERLANHDIQLSGPLFGQGQLESGNDICKIEQQVANLHPKWIAMLQNNGLKQERRALSLYPSNITWQQNEDTLTLEFDLPTGCFATSVLRECVNFKVEQDNEHSD